jgi:hypothetical protein
MDPNSLFTDDLYGQIWVEFNPIDFIFREIFMGIDSASIVVCNLNGYLIMPSIVSAI